MKPGERIKILRMLSGFTQEKLAALAGVNRASLVSWERGDYNPSAPAAESLGKVLLSPPGYFLFGTPSPVSGYWEPSPPKVNKYINSYLQDLESLFPAFCSENEITFCAYYSADNGRLLFLGRPDSPLKFLLLLKPLFLESFSAITSGLELREIAGLKGHPPVMLGFLESDTIETLSMYFRFAKADGLTVDTDAISTAFLKVKKVRGAKTEEDTKSLIKNAFLQFHFVLQEFDPPDSWYPTTTRAPTLIDVLSDFFERIYEEVEEKSLIWGGELDKELADMIRRFLKGQGFKERKRNGNKG